MLSSPSVRVAYAANNEPVSCDEAVSTDSNMGRILAVHGTVTQITQDWIELDKSIRIPNRSEPLGGKNFHIGDEVLARGFLEAVADSGQGARHELREGLIYDCKQHTKFRASTRSRNSA
jgi:hypothetical protein